MNRSEYTHDIDDPNVHEVRAIRARLSARFDDELDRLCDHLRSVEAKYRVVRPGVISGHGESHVHSVD